jgi:hypothetical protein
MSKCITFPVYELRVGSTPVCFGSMEHVTARRDEAELDALIELEARGEAGEFTTPEALDAARAELWPEVLYAGNEASGRFWVEVAA